MVREPHKDFFFFFFLLFNFGVDCMIRFISIFIYN
jgi:hypothetical protein